MSHGSDATSISGSSDHGKYQPIYVADNNVKEIDKSKHLYPSEYEGHLSSVLIDSAQIHSRIKELAQLLQKDFNGQRILLVCVLKGATTFAVHLMDALMKLKQGFEIEFVRASSYRGTTSTGNVEWSGLEHLQKHCLDKHVVIVEDILDTGTTLESLLALIEQHYKSISICTLLDKRIDCPKRVTAKYVGFSIPNHFIVGYGLDYNELYRDLADIFIISQKGINFDTHINTDH